jgi:PAS domain S-box-containing protein
MFSRLSLKYRIAIVIFLLEAVMMSVVLWQTLALSRSAAVEFHAATEDVLLGLMQEIATGALLTEEYSDLQLYVAKASLQPSVRRIFVADTHGKVVAASNATAIGSLMPVMENGEHRFWRQATVASAAGDLGLLAIEFSTEEREQATQRARNLGALLAAVGMSVIAAVGIVVGYALTRRLARVTAAAERFAHGDAEARSGVLGRDEVGWLGQTFDQMVAVVTTQQGQLREQADHIRLLLNSTEEAIYGVGLDGRCTFVNRSCLKILGFGEENDMLGKPVHGLIHHTHCDGTAYPRKDCRIANATQRGESAHCDDECFWRADGTAFPVEYWSRPIVKDGRNVGHVVAFVDVTERKKAEAELLRHRLHLEELVAQRTAEIRAQASIIDQVHDAVVTASGSGQIRSWNKGAQRLFGWSENSARELELAVLFHADEQRKFVQSMFPTLLMQGHLEADVRMQRLDGTAFFAGISMSLLRDAADAPARIALFVMDVTARKVAELAQQRLTEQLTAANKELEAFSYSVSHDLRAPLRSIDGFSQAIVEEHAEQLDEQAKDYLQRVRGSAQRMGHLIDDMLHLSRVTRREIRREHVDLSEAAHKIAGELQEADPQRRVEWVIAPRMSVEGDPGLMLIALRNLLGNAWKYTSRREIAHIEFGQELCEGEEVFFVRDNGAGFDMRYAHKLFGAFQRLHRDKEFEGTGIGLATVQRVLMRHGGRIWAQAEENKGACFYFVIPSPQEPQLLSSSTGALPRHGDDALALEGDRRAARARDAQS